MTERKHTSVGLDVKGKLIIFVVIAFMTVFFCGHLAAVIEAGAGLDNWSELLRNHVLHVPLDFFYINYYVLYFAVCIYALVFFMALSKRELPKAEMKGIEHGSNDFQTVEERNMFLTNNTTPIYSLDLQEFAEEIVKADKSETETFNKGIFKWISEKSR